MFCPKCGAQALEGQRFCKSCGTNLELVTEALEGGEDTLGQFRLDLDAVKNSLKDFGSGINVGMAGWHDHAPEKKAKKREASPPKPKEWLSYSWQHNLRDGLLSLFGGVGLGFVLYFLGQVAIHKGVIKSLEESMSRPIQGLEQIVMWLWLFALIPVLKGVAQIIYAAFFAESMKTLADRFMPPQQITGQQAPSSTAPITANFEEAPPTVTEHTTRIFDSPPRRESQ